MRKSVANGFGANQIYANAPICLTPSFVLSAIAFKVYLYVTEFYVYLFPTSFTVRLP